jgi:hypothetical protein
VNVHISIRYCLIEAPAVGKKLPTRLGSIHGECKIVVLEIETNTRQINDRLYARLFKLSGVTDTAALEDEW